MRCSSRAVPRTSSTRPGVALAIGRVQLDLVLARQHVVEIERRHLPLIEPLHRALARPDAAPPRRLGLTTPPRGRPGAARGAPSRWPRPRPPSPCWCDPWRRGPSACSSVLVVSTPKAIGHAGLAGGVGDAVRDRVGDAPRSACVSPRIRQPRQTTASKRPVDAAARAAQRDLERARHLEDLDRVGRRAGHGERLDGAVAQPRGDVLVEAGDDQRDAQRAGVGQRRLDGRIGGMTQGRAYRPVNCAGRFSRKARVPFPHVVGRRDQAEQRGLVRERLGERLLEAGAHRLERERTAIGALAASSRAIGAAPRRAAWPPG